MAQLPLNDPKFLRKLHAAARAWGVQPSYINVEGGVTWCKPASVVKVLSALSGVEVCNEKSCHEIIERKYRDVGERGIGAVEVFWGGRAEKLFIQVERKNLDQTLQQQITH